MLAKREPQNSNLSFLDVMACGLGAVILVFMLIKHGAAISVPSDEVEKFQADLFKWHEENRKQQETLDSVNADVAKMQYLIRESENEVIQLAQRIKDREKADIDGKNAIIKLKKSVEDVEKTISRLEATEQNKEDHLIGVKVEGERIGILLDSSASMAAETLRDIIKYKVALDEEKKKAPKWQRAQRVMAWLLARVPKKSKLTVVVYDKQARVLSTGTVSRENAKAMVELEAEIRKVIPNNGTNLEAALVKIITAEPRLTNLYVVTDGLPTLGVKKMSIGKMLKCGKLYPGGSKKVTGECRKALFDETIDNFYKNNAINFRVDVILLPLEGDPDAAASYWNETHATGGMLFTPEGEWP